MMDAVLNHVGYGIDAGFHPFNDTDQFHGCQFCATMYCQVINDLDYASVTTCQLSSLPDLNQTGERGCFGLVV